MGHYNEAWSARDTHMAQGTPCCCNSFSKSGMLCVPSGDRSRSPTGKRAAPLEVDVHGAPGMHISVCPAALQRRAEDQRLERHPGTPRSALCWFVSLSVRI